MRLAVVCCDGVPASGLLTVLRNVVDLGIELGLVEPDVAADLGYSWRPDKPSFFRRGACAGYPPWLNVSHTDPMSHVPASSFASQLTAIRDQVRDANSLPSVARKALKEAIEEVAAPYEEYFAEWLDANRADWLIAINMTLSDASPVTLALHRAAATRWSAGQSGGVLFWDHDLFRSCAVLEGHQRVYPERPNEFTPIPGQGPAHRWIVVTDALAEEAARYPTSLAPTVLPNPLPRISLGQLEPRHRDFRRQQGIAPSRPILLAPARIFRPKGIEISISLFSYLKTIARTGGYPPPYLLVFGALAEDAEYGRELLCHAAARNVLADTRFLDGVPVSSFREADGRWRLDEIDLLRLAAASGGGILFTPSQPDVESVGMGPALAACAGIPCALTDYDAFDRVYGNAFFRIRVPSDEEGLMAAATHLTSVLRAYRRGTGACASAREANRRIVLERFAADGWARLLTELTGMIIDPIGSD